MSTDIFKDIVSHCKEYGFIFQSSEIYDGLSGVYDYGSYGVELKTYQATGGKHGPEPWEIVAGFGDHDAP